MIVPLLMLSLFLFFFTLGYTKAILPIIILSLTNDLLTLNIGFSLPVHYVISLLYIPKLLLYYKIVNPRVTKILSPLFIEILYLIFLGIILGFLFPWRSDYDYLRSWSQMAGGKAIVQTVRLVAEFSLLLLIYFWLSTRQITLIYLLKVTAYVISFSVLLAIFDIYFNLGLKQFMFSEARDIGMRFTSLNGEPRSFGRVCSLVLLLLISFLRINKNYMVVIGIILSVIGVFLSFSASTYIMTIAWILLFILITGKFKYLFASIPFLVLLIVYVIKNETFNETTIVKIEQVLATNENIYYKEKVAVNEPEIFGHFEVFDRAALNFLYTHPLFVLIGTGPNLISIPSSSYLTKYSYAIYGKTIDSTPHSFAINLIGRSGLIGLTLWLIFLFRFKIALNNSYKEMRALFVCLMVAEFIVVTSLFFLIAGTLLYITQKKNSN